MVVFAADLFNGMVMEIFNAKIDREEDEENARKMWVLVLAS